MKRKIRLFCIVYRSVVPAFLSASFAGHFLLPAWKYTVSFPEYAFPVLSLFRSLFSFASCSPLLLEQYRRKVNGNRMWISLAFVKNAYAIFRFKTLVFHSKK